ncbi:hypothetical protein KA107_01095 [Candidatus Pacearchaeota archaeon]|nr:hypothetical protein [Candidatus Pacearchaeota archaeon]
MADSAVIETAQTMDVLALYEGGREGVFRRIKSAMRKGINLVPYGELRHYCEVMGTELETLTSFADGESDLTEDLVKKHAQHLTPRGLNREEVYGAITFPQEGPNSREAWETEIGKRRAIGPPGLYNNFDLQLKLRRQLATHF